MRDAQLGRRSAAARRNDYAAFVGDGRQGNDAIEDEESHAHSVKIAACNNRRTFMLLRHSAHGMYNISG